MSAENPNRDLTIVVLSSDNYKDLWPVFAHYFKVYWGNCPYRVCLLTNQEGFQEDGIACLQTGRDVGWSDSLISALKQIDSKFVMFMHEDTLPSSAFNNDIILGAMGFLEKVGGTCVKLRRGRFPFPLSPVPHEPAVGRLSTRLPYRNALFISIWDRLKLLKYLKPGESAWDFETKANSRTECDEEFYSLWNDPFRFVHAVAKGRWLRSAYREVLKEIPGYTTSRPIMSTWEDALVNVYIVARGVFIKTFGVGIFKVIHKVRWGAFV